MKPFPISEYAPRLTDYYPAPEVLGAAGRAMGHVEREGVLRLWLSEGIPFAFRSTPLVFEAVRGWLGKRLEIHPKTITLIGSARIGYSLGSRPKYGQPFGPGSDLDLTAISERLFMMLCEAQQKWRTEFAQGLLEPLSERKRELWKENLRLLLHHTAKGFINVHYIPASPRYEPAQKVLNAMWLVTAKLAETPNAPRVSRASLRVYRDWDAFMKQLYLSFSYTLQSL